MTETSEPLELNPSRSGLAEVLTMALPIIIGVASSTVMGFVDFLMVSRVSVSAAAAVGPAAILVFTVISFFTGVLSCTNTFVAQSFAQDRHSDCARYAWQGLYIALFAGIGALVLWPLAPGLFRLLGHEPHLQPLETVYFQVRLFSIGTLAGITALSGFFQGVGRPLLAMAATLVGNGVNVIANYLLIYGKFGFPEMGVAGAALGTVIACAVQTAVLFIFFLSGPFHRTFQSRAVWKLDPHPMGQLFHIGWPAGLNMSLDVGSWGIFVAAIIGRLGEVPLTASNIAGQMLHVSFMPTVGLSIATTVLVGQHVGRGDYPTARARTRTALYLGMLYMFTMGLVFFFFRRQLVGLFRTEPEIVRIGSQILILCAVFQVFDAIGIVASGALKGAGDTRFPAAVFVIYGWVFFLPAALLMTYVLPWGILGAWGGACIYIIALGLTLLWRWHGRSWESIDIFKTKPVTAADLTPAVTPYEPGDEIP